MSNKAQQIKDTAKTLDAELPEGWEIGFLHDVAYARLGKTPRKADYRDSGSYRVVKFRDLTPRGLDFSATKAAFVANTASALKGLQTLKIGDVLVTASAHSGDQIGKKSCFVDHLPTENGVYFVGELLGITANRQVINPKWPYYWFSSLAGIAAIQDAVFGVHLTSGRAQDMPIPVAPRSEQDRIVCRLDQIWKQLGRAREFLKKVPIVLRHFRQGVLAAACSGKLTEDWREHRAKDQVKAVNELINSIAGKREALLNRERGKVYKKPTEPDTAMLQHVPPEWCVMSVDALTSRITSGSRDWKKYYREGGSGTFVMAQNIRPMHFDRSYRLAIAPPKSSPDAARSEVREGDLLVTIVGANTGDVCRVAEALEEHYVCQSVALMRPVEERTSKFIELYLNSAAHGQAQYREWIYGEGRPHLSFDQLRETAIALPSLEEQCEIIRRVEALFILAETIEKRVAAATVRAEKLTQAILAKAFRGELVPTEAELARREGRNYEPASVFLKRIESEKAAAEQKQPRRLKKAKLAH